MNYYHLHCAENDGAKLYAPDPVYDYLVQGEPFIWPSGLAVGELDGKLYEWIGGWPWAPSVKESVHRRLRHLDDSVQWHGPFVVKSERYFLINCTKRIDCAMPSSDNNRLFLNYSKLAGVQLFRPVGFLRLLIVSEEFKLGVERAGETGVRFGLIQENGWELFPF